MCVGWDVCGLGCVWVVVDVSVMATRRVGMCESWDVCELGCVWVGMCVGSYGRISDGHKAFPGAAVHMHLGHWARLHDNAPADLLPG